METSIRRELCLFLHDVVCSWAGYSTGGVVLALVGLWLMWRGKHMSRKWYFLLSGAFLFTAFFVAWQTRYEAAQRGIKELTDRRPHLYGVEGSAGPSYFSGSAIMENSMYVDRYSNYVCIAFSVGNKGGSPSSTRKWKLEFPEIRCTIGALGPNIFDKYKQLNVDKGDGHHINLDEDYFLPKETRDHPIAPNVPTEDSYVLFEFTPESWAYFVTNAKAGRQFDCILYFSDGQEPPVETNYPFKWKWQTIPDNH
jgi:hypothetical protein